MLASKYFALLCAGVSGFCIACALDNALNGRWLLAAIMCACAVFDGVIAAQAAR